MTTLTLLAVVKEKRPDAYWVFSLQSSQLKLSMLLQLLAPQSGMISKGKQAMWHYIEENLLPMLSQAAVDAKAKSMLIVWMHWLRSLLPSGKRSSNLRILQMTL